MNFTTNQWAIVALVLLLGWLLGLASRNGGRRWKLEAADERARRRTVEERLDVAQARIAELERHAPVAVPVAAAPVVVRRAAGTPVPGWPNG